MKKKEYILPATDIAELRTMSIVCASLPVSETGDPIGGE